MDNTDVLVDAPGSPFDGITLAKAHVLNDAIGYRRVEVIGGKGELKHKPVEYVFHRVLLPGSVTTDPFSGIGDLELWRWENGMGHRHTTRVLSMGLVRSFKVIEAPELSPCIQCGALLAQSELKDAGPLFWDGDIDYDYESRLECKMCWERDW
jgi:hypothetical protein